MTKLINARQICVLLVLVSFTNGLKQIRLKEKLEVTPKKRRAPPPPPTYRKPPPEPPQKKGAVQPNQKKPPPVPPSTERKAEGKEGKTEVESSQAFKAQMEKQDAEIAVQKKTIFQELQNIEKDFVKEKTI